MPLGLGPFVVDAAFLIAVVARLEDPPEPVPDPEPLHEPVPPEPVEVTREARPPEVLPEGVPPPLAEPLPPPAEEPPAGAVKPVGDLLGSGAG